MSADCCAGPGTLPPLKTASDTQPTKQTNKQTNKKPRGRAALCRVVLVPRRARAGAAARALRRRRRLTALAALLYGAGRHGGKLLFADHGLDQPEHPQDAAALRRRCVCGGGGVVLCYLLCVENKIKTRCLENTKKPSQNKKNKKIPKSPLSRSATAPRTCPPTSAPSAAARCSSRPAR